MALLNRLRLGDPQAHHEHDTRLNYFVLVSDAFIVCPGGIGTVLEMMMVWQLLQVRHLHGTRLILAGHFWEGLVDWTKSAMLHPDAPLISPKDVNIPRVVTVPAEIVRIIREHHDLWKQAR